MKNQIIKNEFLFTSAKIENNPEIKFMCVFTTTYQEFFKTGNKKGKEKEISVKCFFKNSEELQEVIQQIKNLEKPYEVFESCVAYRSEGCKISDWRDGLYFNIFKPYEMI